MTHVARLCHVLEVTGALGSHRTVPAFGIDAAKNCRPRIVFRSLFLLLVLSGALAGTAFSQNITINTSQLNKTSTQPVRPYMPLPPALHAAEYRIARKNKHFEAFLLSQLIES